MEQVLNWTQSCSKSLWGRCSKDWDLLAWFSQLQGLLLLPFLKFTIKLPTEGKKWHGTLEAPLYNRWHASNPWWEGFWCIEFLAWVKFISSKLISFFVSSSGSFIFANRAALYLAPNKAHGRTHIDSAFGKKNFCWQPVIWCHQRVKGSKITHFCF